MIRAALSLSVLLATPALAQTRPEVVSAGADTVSVTIYRDNLALITETRTVDLPGGPVSIAFSGVLDSVIPQSAVVRGLDGAKEKERNFDFDGLTPRSLMWKSIGERVRIVRGHKKRAAAIEEPALIAAAGDGVTLRYADRVEALGCSGLPEKIIFDKVPAGLRADPTLSTTLEAPPGQRTLTLSYLATGLEWKADYVVTLAPDGESADVQAWVTLTNDGERGFPRSQVGVIAGDLSRVFTPSQARAYRQNAQRNCWPIRTTSDIPRRWDDFAAGAIPPPPPPPPPPMAAMAPVPKAADMVVTAGRRVEQEDLGDYKLYALVEPTDLASRQTKQVLFLKKTATITEKVHRVDLSWLNPDARDDVRSADILLRFKNTEEKGLGAPLPEGAVRIMAPSAGGPLFIGEDEKRDTAVGLDWEIKAGASTAVTARPRLVARTETKLRDGRTRVVDVIDIDLANALPRATTLEVSQTPLGGSLRIDQTNARWRMKDGDVTWSIPLPAGGRTSLRYRMRYVEG